VSGALAGRTIVVTRAADQSSALVARLRERGATVIEVPTIAIADPADGGAALTAAVGGLDGYDWVVLTSTNGAARFLAALAERPPGAPVPPIAVVGPGTAAAVRQAGIEPALVPGRFVAEGLLADFPAGPGRILLPQADAARPVLADGLAAAGWVVDAIVAYRTVAADAPPALLERARAADAITFTSGSTVAGYLAAAGDDAVPPVVACIGPVTADAARAAGVAVAAVATEHTIDGLIAALEGVLAP
jgi:uroporphyrinogen-III synthase